MILAAHQPDLLPWSGFWHKMAMADLFDLAIYDQFQKDGYQRRVKMRGDWVGWMVEKPSGPTRIAEVRVNRDESISRMKDVVLGRYRGARYWNERSDMVMDWFDSVESDLLWQANLTLILKVRALLGIETPICIARPPADNRTDGLLDVIRQYRPASNPYVQVEYLSGVGGRAYMDEDLLERERQPVIWSRHQHVTGDSILSLIFDYADPTAAVMAVSE